MSKTIVVNNCSNRSLPPKKNTFKHCGWTFRTSKSHILGTNGHFSWKRELNCFQGQSLPDAIFHKNSLEILHEDTGIRIRFCALEALRAWASLELKPVKALDSGSKHWKNRINITPSVDYDYTYTTLYSGGIDIIDQTSNDYDNDFHYLLNDSSSFVAKKIIDDSTLGGPARLRKPICKCKGEGGRAPFVKKKNNKNEINGDSLRHDDLNSEVYNTINVASPQWEEEKSQRNVDIEGMIRKFPQPLFFEVIDLYEDDLHENGTCFLRAKIFVTPTGWVGLLRFFLRVDRVMARVIDTRLIHHFGDNHVLRERSWREGCWKDLLGGRNRDNSTNIYPGYDPHVHVTSLESLNDSLAARVLRLKEPATTESLSLKKQTISSYKKYSKSSGEMDELWKIHSYCLHTNVISNGIFCPTPFSIYSTLGICMVSIGKDGKSISAVPTITNNVTSIPSTTESQGLLWEKALRLSSNSIGEEQMITFLSLQVSSDTNDGGRLVLGDDRGWGHIWCLQTGEPLFTFPVANEQVRSRCSKLNIASARLWVDNVKWSKCGDMIGAAAGRSAVLVSAHNGQILSFIELTEGSITDIAFRNRSLGVASYGIVRWLAAKNENSIFVPEKIKRAGASIQCIDISPDGTWIALGFLDKTVRVIKTVDCKTSEQLPDEADLQKNIEDARDWVGFNAPVKSVRFSENGNWLAAMGGSSILVIPKFGFDSKIDAPIVCRTNGLTTSDGCDGTCKRFLSFRWSPSEENLLLAIDASSEIHMFDVTKTDQGWPKRTFPALTFVQ